MPGRVVQQRLRRARVQPARDLDGGEQGLAAGNRLEGQAEKGGQVAAQVAVARGHLVHEAALLQPGEGAAVRGRLTQLGFLDGLVEPGDGRALVGVEQHVHGAEKDVQPVLRTPAQGTVLLLKRQA
jgi:hypothetical protein